MPVMRGSADDARADPGSGADPDAGKLARFRARYRDDRALGHVRTLAEYLGEFGGPREEIAAAYLDLECERMAAGESAPAGPAAAAADSVGPFRLLEELGRGGQGAVYLAEDTRLGRRVALKILSGVGRLPADRLARFRREAEVASRLDHPGICAVFEAGTAGPVPYIAMRFVEGENLARRIARERDPDTGPTEREFHDLSQAPAGAAPSDRPTGDTARRRDVRPWVNLIRQAAEAVHVAHEAGIVHRDIKPGNIIVTPEGQPVLVDFGLALDLDSAHPTLTGSGDIFGTPAYMAPEQLMGRRIGIDRRMDVYALGVTLYECVTLRRPFEEPTRQELYRAILTKTPPDPRSFNPAIASDLKVVLETALERDLERRYQTAHDLAEDLRCVLESRPILARPAGPLVRLRRWYRRNPAVAWSVSGLFLSLAAGLCVAVVLLGISKRRGAELERKEAALSAALGEARAAESRAAANAAALEISLSVLREHADRSAIYRLRREAAEDLWPRHPDRLEAMNAWLEEADGIVARHPVHAAARDEVILAAEPPSAAERLADEVRSRAAHPDLHARLDAVRTRLGAIETERAGRVTESRAAAVAEERDRLEAEQAAIEDDPRVTRRWNPRFRDPAVAARFRRLEELAGEIGIFRSVRDEVAARRDYVLSARSDTLGDPAGDWKTCIADVSTLPVYGGLKLAPQYELVPLGKNEAGLWEFWHMGSGERPARDPTSRRVVMAPGTGLVLVLIPGGDVRIGAQRDDASGEHHDPDADPDRESPVVGLRLDAFFLSKFEVTQGQWLRLAGANPSWFRVGLEVLGSTVTPVHPVERISFEDCMEVLDRNNLELPTEAQWERACRAGTGTPWSTGSDRGGLRGFANLADAAARGARMPWQPEDGFERFDDGWVIHGPAGSYEPNLFGLHDMHGNVSEWCRDVDAPMSAGTHRTGDGLHEAAGWSETHVIRGGSFAENAIQSRCSAFARGAPWYRVKTLGVRPARRITAP